MTISTIEVTPSDLKGRGDAERQAYLNTLISQRAEFASEVPNWVKGVRDRNLTLIQDQALPSSRTEEWRFTDPSRLYKIPFQSATATVTTEQITPYTWSDTAVQFVFVNGVFDAALSSQVEIAGVKITTLKNLDTSFEGYLGRIHGAEEVFTALNSCNFTDAAVLKVDRNQIIEAPIHLLFVTAQGEQPTASYPRVLVVAESGSSVTLVEDFVSEGTETFTDAVAEISLAANAQVNHIRIQREQPTAIHIGKTAVSQQRDSRYRAIAISLGGQFSRYNPEIVTEEQTETILDGLTLATDSQVADTHSALTFMQPHCQAQQLHKCIVDDQARAVFNGRIFVPKAAQQTNAAQLSRNLLLSPKARVDTKPQLEIVADDVKCAHGATVSQLEDDEVFYLQSRGLNHDNACDLLVKAFAAEILEKIPVASIRQGLLDDVLSRLR
ncbi:MAG: Fe-S cluster assembly protein SufD [Thermosynechococcaceae cyanobacterium]